jgi:hypothetical protein
MPLSATRAPIHDDMHLHLVHRDGTVSPQTMGLQTRVPSPGGQQWPVHPTVPCQAWQPPITTLYPSLAYPWHRNPRPTYPVPARAHTTGQPIGVTVAGEGCVAKLTAVAHMLGGHTTRREEVSNLFRTLGVDG